MIAQLDPIDGSFAVALDLPSVLMPGENYILSVQYDFQSIEEAYTQILTYDYIEDSPASSRLDIDASGCVDIVDFAIFAEHWLTGSCCL